MKQIDHADLLVKPGSKVDLDKYDPKLTCEFASKHDAKEKLNGDIEHLAALQNRFYADARFAVLIILQGMDTAGKDGVIKHVMSGINPQGVHVESFKQPSTEELAHDYLWRAVKVLPERGRIGIFNRSYYEEVVIVRVHRYLLNNEHLPTGSVKSDMWAERFEGIRAFENHLVRNGTVIIKIFLHVSKEEQRSRLLKRIDMPEKNWKMSTSDVHERSVWDKYQYAYEQVLTHTSTEEAPWYIIPADHKWFTRAAVADIVVARIKALDLQYPDVGEERRQLLITERKQLSDEDKESRNSLLEVKAS